MALVLILVVGFGCFVVVEEEGIVAVREDDVFPKEGVLEEGVVVVDLFEEVVVALDEPKLVATFGVGFVVEAKGVLSY